MESSVEELRHSMIKSFMDSVVTNINVRTDGVVKDVAQLKASLDFRQNDLYSTKLKRSSQSKISFLKSRRVYTKPGLGHGPPYDPP